MSNPTHDEKTYKILFETRDSIKNAYNQSNMSSFEKEMLIKAWDHVNSACNAFFERALKDVKA